MHSAPGISQEPSPAATVCLRAKPFWDAAWRGAFGYSVAIVLVRPDVLAAVLLLAALVLVPLAIDLVRRDFHGAMPRRLLHAIAPLQFPAAVLLAVALAVPDRFTSTLFALPWCGLTCMLATSGAIRLRRGAWRDPAELGISVAFMFVAVGGAWILMYRAGIWPGGFPKIIAGLTAVHFHYAGFALPIIAGLAARECGWKVAKCLVPILAVSTLLLAVGITFSPLLEVTAALVLAITAGLVAAAQLKVAVLVRRPAVATMLAVSSVSLLSGMALAGIFACGEYLAPSLGLSAYSGGGWLDVPSMIRLHGLTLAFGFALTGLLGWQLPGERRQESVL